MLTVTQISLALLHPEFYDIQTAILAFVSIATFSVAASRAKHHHIQRLACVTLGISFLLIIGIVGLPIQSPDWRGDRLRWFQFLTPFIVTGSILGFAASHWGHIRGRIDTSLNKFLTDRTRALSWGASSVAFYFVSAATFTFEAANEWLRHSYSAIFSWLPRFPFRVSRVVHAIFEIPVTLMFVVGLPIIIILLVGADTVRNRVG